MTAKTKQGYQHVITASAVLGVTLLPVAASDFEAGDIIVRAGISEVAPD